MSPLIKMYVGMGYWLVICINNLPSSNFFKSPFFLFFLLRIRDIFHFIQNIRGIGFFCFPKHLWTRKILFWLIFISIVCVHAFLLVDLWWSLQIFLRPLNFMEKGLIQVTILVIHVSRDQKIPKLCLLNFNKLSTQ